MTPAGRVPQDDGAEYIRLGWITNDGYWRLNSDRHWQPNRNLKTIKENVILTVATIIWTRQQTYSRSFYLSANHLLSLQRNIQNIAYDRFFKLAKSTSHYLLYFLLTGDYTKSAVIANVDTTTEQELISWVDTSYWLHLPNSSNSETW